MRRVAGSMFIVTLVISGFAAVGSSQTAGVQGTDVGWGTVDSDYTIKGGRGTDVVVERLTIEPGASVPWHTHPGPDIGIVMAGTMTVVHGDDPECGRREYRKGQAYLDTGDLHTVRNLGKERLEILVTFFNVPAGGSVIEPAERPSHCRE